MKRIGILTMHRVQNYGSALQAYALQEYINRLGYDAELIDYIFPNSKHKQQRPLIKRIKSLLFKWAFCLSILRKNKRFAHKIHCMFLRIFRVSNSMRQKSTRLHGKILLG